MKESATYLKLRGLLLPFPIQFQRIEYQRVPDLYFKTEHSEGWIELKDLKKLTGTIRIPFRPGQFAWIQKQVRLNGTVYLFCTDENDVLWIFKNDCIKRSYNQIEFTSLVHEALDMDFMSGKDLYDILNN